jgi:Na+/melibiose symporter-like transporter
MSLLHNERTKLTATWLNTLAAATVVTGVIAPMVAVVFGLPTSGTVSPTAFMFAIAVWLLLGVALHIVARRVLRRLQE